MKIFNSIEGWVLKKLKKPPPQRSRPVIEALLRCKSCGVVWSVWGPTTWQPDGSMSMHSSTSCENCETAGAHSDVFEEIDFQKVFPQIKDTQIDLPKQEMENKKPDTPNDKLRARSGEMVTDSPLVAFLYSLLRDFVHLSDVEKIIQDDESFCNKTDDKVWSLSNGYLGRYAQDIADRIVSMSSVPAKTKTEFDRNGKMFGEEVFKEIAKENPVRLLHLIKNGNLKDSQLTYATEVLGSTLFSSEVREALILCLDHPKPLVREGALYGLWYQREYWTSEQTDKIKSLEISDPSQEIRDIVHEVLLWDNP